MKMSILGVMNCCHELLGVMLLLLLILGVMKIHDENPG